MPPETIPTAAEAAADTSSTGEQAEGTVSDETGGASAEEIAAALGPKFKTVAPVADKEETEEVENADDKTEADAEQEAETEEEAPAKPAKADEQEVAADPNVKDFSFTVEDADGTTYKIAPGDNIEDVLKDFNQKNNGQIIAILEQLREAKDSQAKYEADQQTATAEAEKAERVTAIQEGWKAEEKDLQATKRIPAGKDGEERIGAVYKYMADENSKRLAAGRPTIGSLEDALDKLENKEGRDAKVAQDKADKEEARKNGALVGGASATNVTTTPVYKAGSARNANQALRAQGLI
jgi:hypothetical protein